MAWHSYSKEVLAIVKVVSVWLHSMSHCACKMLKNNWNAFLLVLLQYMSLFPFSRHWIALLANCVSCNLENILSRCLKICGWKFPSWFHVCMFPEGMSEIKHRTASVFLRRVWLQCLSIVCSLDEELRYVIQPVLYSVKAASSKQSCCRDRGQALPLSLNTT